MCVYDDMHIYSYVYGSLMKARGAVGLNNTAKAISVLEFWISEKFHKIQTFKAVNV